MAKSREWIDAVEEIIFTWFYEVHQRIEKIGQKIGAQRPALLEQPEKQDATKKYSIQGSLLNVPNPDKTKG